jgi:3-oxoacyl-[acyl-carrier-protein] synthase-3
VDHALVVAGENSRPILENTLTTLLSPGTDIGTFFRNFATLTLGSGGAAMLLGRAEEDPQAPRPLSLSTLSDPLANDLCRGTILGMETDSALLLTRGVDLAKRTFLKGQNAFGWQCSDFDLFLCHQVSEANTQKFAEARELPLEKIFKTYPTFGNMGPVAIPFSFDLAREKGLITPGSRLAFMGIGSGLRSSLMEIWVP